MFHNAVMQEDWCPLFPTMIIVGDSCFALVPYLHLIKIIKIVILHTTLLFYKALMIETR